MAKSKIQKVAEILGIELNENFKIKYGSGNVSETEYVITENGLWDTLRQRQDSLLFTLLCGHYTIVRLQYKPKLKDVYYTYFF